jgi:hypothetical protein
MWFLPILKARHGERVVGQCDLKSMSDQNSFNPALMFAANNSFNWIFKCHQSYNSNQDSKLRDLIAPHMFDGKCDLINPGLVLAACYIYFVYPREALQDIDLSSLDVSSFKVSKIITPSELIRRIRNALSHGNYEIDDDGTFRLRDNNPKETNPFEATIHFTQLGEFADQFAKLALNWFFQNEKGLSKF